MKSRVKDFISTTRDLFVKCCWCQKVFSHQENVHVSNVMWPL